MVVILLLVIGATGVAAYIYHDSPEFCSNCHSHDHYEDLAKRTAFWELAINRHPHASPHYENLECNVCHRSHRESETYCSECHEMPYLGEGWEEPPILENPVLPRP